MIKRLLVLLAALLAAVVEAGAFFDVGEGAKWDDYMATFSDK